MKSCYLRLLGCFEVHLYEANTMALGGRTGLLLAYLILTMEIPQSRKQIAFTFWPDSSEKQALSNLRKLLHDVREQYPDLSQYIQVCSHSIQWNRDMNSATDVSEFEKLAQGETIQELIRAEQLYRGELLPGYDEEWLIPKREAILQLYEYVLERLVSLFERKRDYSAAILYANKLLALDQWKESSYGTLMRLYSLSHDLSSTTLVYNQLCRKLQDDMGAEPSEEMKILYHRLMKPDTEHVVRTNGSPFVGRDEEWKIMTQLWKSIEAGSNGLLLLKGEAGIGKTKLATEFKAWVGNQGYRTPSAFCHPSSEALSYASLTSWLRSYPIPLLEPVWLMELSRLMPELQVQYPDLPSPSPIGESWQLGRWYEAMERALLVERPVLLHLDDMQWSSREMLRLLSYLLRIESKANFLVVATMRTDDWISEAIQDLLFELRTRKKLTEIQLAPISKEDIEQLMNVMVGHTLASRLSANLFKETAGNPLFVVETLREWQVGEDPNVYRLSSMVQIVIENRLRQLPPDRQRLVSIASVIGRPFTPELLAAILKRQEEDVLEQLERLRQQNFLQEDQDGRYDFTHDKVREVAYQQLNANKRRLLHKQLALTLASIHHRQLTDAASEIALHFERAGLQEESIPYYEAAAKAAQEIYAYETAVKHYYKIYEMLPPEQNFDILMRLGEAWRMMGNWKEAENAYRMWLKHSGYSMKERSHCDVLLGDCLRLQGYYEEARYYLERALHHFRLLEDQAGLGLVYGTLGVLYYYTGKNEQALELLIGGTDLPLTGQRSRDHCRFSGIIGNVYYSQCEYENALDWFKREIKLAYEIEEQVYVGQAMGGLALIYMDTDQMEEAYHSIVEKLEISKSIGDRMGLANAMGLLGKYFLLIGERAKATECNTYCLEEAIAINDVRVAAIVNCLEGLNLVEQTRYVEADTLLDRSIRLSRQIQTPYYECDALYFSSLLKVRQGQIKEAIRTAEEALDIADRLKRKEMAFAIRLLLIRLKADIGEISIVSAVDQLKQWSGLYPSRQEQAAIHYVLWKLCPHSQQYKIAAYELNEQLYQLSAKVIYSDRCKKIIGSEWHCDTRPLPHLSFEIPHFYVAYN